MVLGRSGSAPRTRRLGRVGRNQTAERFEEWQPNSQGWSSWRKKFRRKRESTESQNFQPRKSFSVQRVDLKHQTCLHQLQKAYFTLQHPAIRSRNLVLSLQSDIHLTSSTIWIPNFSIRNKTAVNRIGTTNHFGLKFLKLISPTTESTSTDLLLRPMKIIVSEFQIILRVIRCRKTTLPFLRWRIINDLHCWTGFRNSTAPTTTTSMIIRLYSTKISNIWIGRWVSSFPKAERFSKSH